MQNQPKKRILILGGGMGSLTAAFQLTHPDNPRRDDHEVTVLQMGHRLGGKGASGRNLEPAYHGRIEEHGLHNLFGFYDSTFRLMRQCYAELGRPADAPLASFRDAVRPESSAVFVERAGGEWLRWRVLNPANELEPGEGGALLPLWDTIVLLLEFLDLNVWRAAEDIEPPLPNDGQPHPRPGLLPLAVPFYAAARAALAAVSAARRAAPGVTRAAAPALERAAAAAIRAARRAAWARYRSRLGDHHARRAWILLHFGASIAVGLLEDGALRRGLDSLNDRDFRAWLAPFALDDGGVMLGSALMRVVYDSSFAYLDGDTRAPDGECAPGASYEAGTLLRGLLRAAFTYKGAFGWKLNGGTGDVLFAPLYLVLRRRGVRFRFFHEVRRVGCTADGRLVDRVVVAEQARVTREQEARGGYDPLVDFDGLPCWPSRPRHEQLEDGEALARAGVDFESPLPPGREVAERTLQAGRDFDEVVLGISAGALPYLCQELIEISPKWSRMVRHLRTVRTQALQVWLRPSAEELGWPPRGQPITGFWYDEESPLNVWADMSHLLPWEGARGRAAPGHLSYFVSPMRDEVPLAVGPHGPIDTPAGLDAGAARGAVAASARRLLERHAGDILLPGAAGEGGGFRWDLLIDERPGAPEGPARLEAQYLRANVAPSERYVLSVPGSTRHRLHAHDPDEFVNLYLAGDWTRNGLNCGAMESAVLGGLLAASALSGFPRREDIVGLEFL